MLEHMSPLSFPFRRIACAAITMASLLAAPTLVSAQNLSQRLILKDGSYQIISKYEMKGDRVRYYSTEREEWEELPASLVDWPATEKAEKERAAAAAKPEAIELDKELENDRQRAEQQQPQVAPGLRLPEESGVYLLDSFQGEPELDELQQSAGDLNRSTKGNIFRGAINPVAGLKQTVELDGSHAKIQSHADVPSLYINVDPASEQPEGTRIQLDTALNKAPERQQPEQPQEARVPFDRFRILRAEVKGNKRILGDVKRAATGKVSQDQRFVKTTITDVKGGWLKVTPTENLPPGEYALVEMVGKDGMNLDVWDFGVNPKAPANADSWKPEPKDSPKPASSTTGPEKTN